MTIRLSIALLLAAAAAATAQENKPVPKDSVRVSVPGCTKGRMFTAGRRTADEPGAFEITEGTHLRMNGPKKMMSEIKEHEASMIVITGLMRKGQYKEGARVGGVRITGAPLPRPGSLPAAATEGPMAIDVESWRPIVGSCR